MVSLSYPARGQSISGRDGARIEEVQNEEKFGI